MKWLILYLWQLPQHLLALVIYLIVNGASFHYYSKTTPVTLITHKYRFGVSLGTYIFLPVNHKRSILLHEWGHSVQSKMLGPLYLIVVGIPSITMNILSIIGILNPENYYKRWPESWADKLGGVDNT